MQSYWMTNFSCVPSATASVAKQTESAVRASWRSFRITMVSPRRSELDLELVEHGGPPAGAGLEGAVAAAVEMLADEVDLPARPAVEPDVGAGGDGDDLAAVDRAQRVARELRHL